jgi:hypothetical protein
VKESLPKLMLLRVSNCEEESPYKPEIPSATLGGHFEFEYEQKTQQLGAMGFKTFWQ